MNPDTYKDKYKHFHREAASHSTPPLWTPATVLIMALLSVLAAILRFHSLARKPFWFDECFSVEVARLSWHDFAFLLWRREANMSLYYLLLRGWLHFGSSPFFMRSLSVVISVSALPAFFWLTSELFDRRVGLIAAALLSCNAYHIRYAQEARSYSLFFLLSVLSSGFFISKLRYKSRSSSAAYILSSTLAVYSHLYALLLLAAQWISARKHAASRDFRQAWIWIASAALPLIVFAVKTGAGPIRWIPRPGFRDVLHFAESLAGNNGVILLLFYALSCGLAITSSGIIPFTSRDESAVAEAMWNRWRIRFLLLWLFFPIALVLLLSLARPLFLGRYFIFCLPPLLILCAAGLAQLGSKTRPAWLLPFCFAVMLLLSLQGTFSYYKRDFDLDRDDSQSAVNYILEHARPGDAILFHIAEARVPYEFFKSLRDVTFAPASPTAPEIVYPNHGPQLDYRDFTGKPTPEFVQSLGARYPRLWVVLMSNGAPQHPDATTLMLNPTLSKSFPRVDTVTFPQIVVNLYSQQ